MQEKIKLSIEYFGLSDIGMLRAENQDSFGKFPEDNFNLYSDKGQLFIVADGVGGHIGGKEASSLAVDIIREVYFSSDAASNGEALKEAVEEANLRIIKKAESSTDLVRMATTCSALALKDTRGIIAHVGDSRIYKIENNKIQQLTNDHTKVLEMLKEGILTKEEANNYPSKSILARALGTDEKVKVDLIENIILKEGESFLLCSDGLAKVTDDEIKKIISENSSQDSCSKLITLANDRGGKDNVTVIVIKIKAEQSVPAAVMLNAGNNRNKRNLFFLIAIIFILFIIGFQFKDSFLPLLNFNEKDIKNIESSLDEERNNSKEKDIYPEGTSKDLLETTDKMLEDGKYEKALLGYQNILTHEPMHLGALDGINKIITIYLTNADKLRNENKFEEALKFYLIIEEIQPENEKVKNLISICENQIQFVKSNPALSIEGNTILDESIEHNKIVISKFNKADWSFINTESSQYNFDGSGIKFFNTSIEKKSLFNLNLYDAVVSVDLKIFSASDGCAGIIFGYNSPEYGKEHNYYLLKYYSDNNYILQKIRGSSAEQLLSVQPINENINTGNKKLKIQCSDNLIKIFNENGLINSWKSSQKIFGKVGVYADKNVLVKFTNIYISGNN